MEGRPTSAMRPRSALRPRSTVATLSASTEFMERGAMVGAGQYSLTKTSSNANALQLPGPLVLPQQPDSATPPLTSPAIPTPGPPSTTAADLRAMVAALDACPSPTPTAPSSPAPPRASRPGQPSAPSSPHRPAAQGLEPAPALGSPKLCLAAAADGANRIPSPVHSPLRSPSSSLGPAAGSLKLFCSGVVGGIDRCPSPGPCSSPRQSLTLFPGREESAAVAAAAAAASPGESVPSPQRSDATAAAAAAASSPSSSPGRQGWLEKVYSAKSLSAPSAAAAGDDVVSGVGVGAGAGGELVSPGRGVSAPACRSPRGSPGRNTRGIGHAHTDAASPSLPSRMTGASRTTTPLQCLYGPTPTQAPLAVVASASEDWSEAATGTGDGGGAGPRESLAVREGLRAYLMLSPPSPSASVSAVTLAAAAATGNSPLASNSSLGERSAGGSPRRGSPAAIAAAASAALSRSSSVSSVHLTPAASPGRQAVVAPAVQQVTGAAAAATADVMSYPCAPPPRSPSRSAGELSDRSSTTSPVAGSGSAVLVRGPHGSPALASATGKISPVASQPSAGGGFGRDGRTAAAASAAGQRSPASAPQPRQRQQKGGGGGGSSGGGVRREELLDEEEDPAVVLEQSIALLSDVEGLIRESVGLLPDHPLQAIPPDLAHRIPLQLVEALEDTLEVIALARRQLARKATSAAAAAAAALRQGVGEGLDKDRDRDDRAHGPPWHGPGFAGTAHPGPVLYCRNGGGGGSGSSRRISRSGSQPGVYGNGYGSVGSASRSSRGSWAGGGGAGGGSPGSHLPPISGGGGGGSSGGGAASGRSGLPLYGGRPSSHQQHSRPSSQRQPPNHHNHQPPYPPPRSVSASRRTSGSASGGGGGGSGGGGSIPSVPSTLAASISSRRAWHREGPPEEWWTAKLAKADAERRKREAQLAADLRYLQQIRTRTTEVQHTHEALLAQSEEALRAARSAKASTEAQHRWLQYQDAVAEGARRHFEHLTNHN